MQFEPEPEVEIRRYRLCTVGFAISALSIGLLSINSGLWLWANLTRDNVLFQLLQQRWWSLIVGFGISGGALLGSYLFWGRWIDERWQRRVGVLVALNFFDFAYSLLDRLGEFGVNPLPDDHDWLIGNLITGFGWIEFYLFADLASEVALHLGRRGIREAGNTAKLFALAGLTISIVYLTIGTDWMAGWPLQEVPIPDFMRGMIALAFGGLRMMNSLQVAALCLAAALATRQTTQRLQADALKADPFADNPNERPDAFGDPQSKSR